MLLQPTTTTTPATTTPQPEANRGIHGTVADALRGTVGGYAAATRSTSIAADKAAIHPFESVSTLTGLIKDKTANIKYVNKATGLLHTIGGFALLIGAANVSGGLRAPGDTARDLGNRIADAIDGQQTARGWSLGWGVVAEPEQGEQPEVAQSAIGAGLASLGMN